MRILSHVTPERHSLVEYLRDCRQWIGIYYFDGVSESISHQSFIDPDCDSTLIKTLCFDLENILKLDQLIMLIG